MPRRTIAPVLTEVIEKVWRFDPERRFDAVDVETARRELRALDGLVRVLDRHMADPVAVGFRGVERARERLARLAGDGRTRRG